MARPFFWFFTIVLALGIFFRVYHVDRKVYWDDEVFSSLHMLGYTEAEIVRRSDSITDGRSLREVLHPEAAAPKRSLGDTINSIVSEDPHHTPLYYVAGHFWIQWFGDSIAAIRSLSVLAGVVALPCMYWLCLELFSSRIAASLGTALLAISPFEVLYSQEAREYSCWTVAVLVIAATFLRALRRDSRGSWGAYASALAFGLYVFPFTGFIILANIAFVFLVERERVRKHPYRFPLALLCAIVSFAPWLALVVHHVAQIDRAMETIDKAKSSPIHIARSLFGMFKLDIFDFNLAQRFIANVAMTVPAIALIGYAIYDIFRRGERRVGVFILSIVACSAAPLVIADLLLSGQRSANPRYFLPLFLAVDLALTSLFVNRMYGSALRQRVWRVAFGVLLSVRLASCVASSQAQTWWNKLDQKSIAVADTINETSHPILIGDDYIEWALSVGNYLRPDVVVALRPRCYLCSIGPRPELDVAALSPSRHYDGVYLLGPSKRLQADVRAALRVGNIESSYRCIDVRSNCASPLSLW